MKGSVHQLWVETGEGEHRQERKTGAEEDRAFSLRRMEQWRLEEATLHRDFIEGDAASLPWSLAA